MERRQELQGIAALQEEIEQLRQLAVFRATPIKRYKDVEGVETKELTVPLEPILKTSQRMRQ